MSGIYDTLNKEWKNTCRVLLLREIGEMKEYEGWLRENLEPVESVKSAFSGKEILAVGDYPKDAKFISFDEVDQGKKFAPLNINDVKDIDSIARAVGERAVYCGNIVLGNSSQIEASTGIEDSHFVLGSHTFHKSQHVAYCTLGREDRNIFGCGSSTGESSFCIKCGENWRSTRCLATTYGYESSDIYFSHYLYGCQDCMFCFNLRGKKHNLGNVQLEKGKYLELKKKLVEEIASELEKNKRIKSLEELVLGAVQKKKIEGSPVRNAPKKIAADLALVKQSFAQACELILGKRLELQPLGKYLEKHVRSVYQAQKHAGKKDFYACRLIFEELMVATGRAANWEELDELSHQREWPENIPIDGFGFGLAGKLIEPIAYFCPDKEMQAANIIECSNSHSASNCYKSSKNYFSKCIAFSFWSRNSEHVFGCESLRNSSFCIKCYNSYKLSRCFEADTSQNCTGCYFIHNCENVHDSMFCFNVKNLRYAIGNAQVGREKFMEAKQALQKYILERLEKEKELGLDIYNIGTMNRKN